MVIFVSEIKNYPKMKLVRFFVIASAADIKSYKKITSIMAHILNLG